MPTSRAARGWPASANLNPAANVVPVGVANDDPAPDHWTDRLLHRLAPHRTECEATRQILRSVADRGLGLQRPGGGGVVIHPGSGSPAKCWPVDRFADLARQQTAVGRRVRFVVGDVERDRWPTATLDMLATVSEVRRPATLLDLFAELLTADVFVGNDSGPAHLAGIAGVPTVALFGPTDPARWHPLGPAVRTLRRDPLADLPVSAVLDALPTG